MCSQITAPLLKCLLLWFEPTHFRLNGDIVHKKLSHLTLHLCYFLQKKQNFYGMEEAIFTKEISKLLLNHKHDEHRR